MQGRHSSAHLLGIVNGQQDRHPEQQAAHRRETGVGFRRGVHGMECSRGCPYRTRPRRTSAVGWARCLLLPGHSGEHRGRSARDLPMSGPKVLVVDDDRDTLALYTTALKLSGFDVLAAENGLQALRLVDREAPDAVVTDLAMPGMDGVAFCRHLRASPVAHQVPVVAVSGQASPSLTSDARCAGCDEVLSKPCLPDQLVETLDRLIDAPPRRPSPAGGDVPPRRDRLPGESARRWPEVHWRRPGGSARE
ncbi:MAG: response regulator [Acidobacteria bacterium]|nr:MAG: response regulator [Acidobacteriota bacterium]